MSAITISEFNKDVSIVSLRDGFWFLISSSGLALPKFGMDQVQV